MVYAHLKQAAAYLDNIPDIAQRNVPQTRINSRNGALRSRKPRIQRLNVALSTTSGTC